jgi:hypothetical protein
MADYCQYVTLLLSSVTNLSDSFQELDGLCYLQRTGVFSLWYSLPQSDIFRNFPSPSERIRITHNDITTSS